VADRAIWLGPAKIIQTTSDDGDVGHAAIDRDRHRIAAVGHHRWTTVHQVHGSSVVVANDRGDRSDVDADGIVTTSADLPIALFGADCPLVALASPNGVVGLAHAGWRGLVAGIIPSVVSVMREHGANEIVAAVSPMIHPECYAFGADDLVLVTRALGGSVEGRTSGGELALDLPRGVELALHRAGVDSYRSLGGCTACEPGWFSWRARRDLGRHALVAWLPAT
jgi:YfiH family protein